MKAAIIRLATVAAIAMCCSAQAQEAPLSPTELAQCASQVQGLRAESTRLIRESSHVDAQREAINRRTQNLEAQGAALHPDDLKSGLALHDQRQRHNQETMVFNCEVAQLRREIIAVNQVKQDYERDCSNRPYRRSDLNRLPQAAQNAMRTGLSDVSVPYLDSASALDTINP